MATTIKCPSCGHTFPIGEAVTEEYKKELREQMIVFTRKKEEEYKVKMSELSRQMTDQQNEFNRKLLEERKTLQELLEPQLRKTIGADFEIQLKMLEHANLEKEEKLKASREKELEYLRREQEIRTREAELELSVQRRLQEERTKVTDEIRQFEEKRSAAKETEFKLRVMELEKQLVDQKRLVDEMNRRAEQGSMQLQGEVQELALEDLLRTTFPFDLVQEVGKGKRGADCILTVRNNFGQECGKIIYESKRTESFATEWIGKLKDDMRNLGAHVAVIVTKAMPRDMEGFGEKDGVWICSFSEVRALSHVLRDSILKIFNVTKSQDNKGDKMHLLYNYLTSSEFSEQWKAIREGFLMMRHSIQRERDAMEKLWKAREKQLEKVLLNASHIKGSVEGIAGHESIDLNLLEDGEESALPG
jgi:hypothetical protein